MGTRLERFQETFGLDLRSLAVLRILIGCMLVVDYAIRAVSLRSHYTDFGVVPSAWQTAHIIDPHPGRFSFHLASGDLNLQIALLGLSLLFAIFLIVGFQSRLSMVASLVLMISIQNRNMEIETGGDYLLRLVAFWCVFLPVGARFSLDARRGLRRPDPKSGNVRGNQFFSVATVALLVQMAIVYFFSALHKGHPIWRVHDTAIHYALHIDSYDTWLGEVLRQFPVITGAFTRLTLGYEFVAPLLIFGAGVVGLVPGLEKIAHPIQGTLRSFISVTFIFFHLGLASSLSLGTFPWFAALIWCGLFPTYAWDRLDDFRKGVIPRDPYEEAERAAKKKKGESGQNPKSEEGDGSDTEDAEESPPWLYRLRTPQVLSAMSRVEDFFVRFETPPKKKKRRRRPPVIVRRLLSGGADLAAAVALFYTVLWNLNTLEREPWGAWIAGREDTLLPDARPAINFFRLDQHWGLFAPYPRTTDGYYVVLGTQKSGGEIDFLRDDHEVTWEKPADVSGSYETFRWRKYFRNIRRRSKRQNLQFYSEYVCRAWNESHQGDEQIERVSIFFMARKTAPEGGHEPTKKERLWVQGCQSAYKPYELPRRMSSRGH